MFFNIFNIICCIGFVTFVSRTSGFVSINPSKNIQKSTKIQTYINPWSDLSSKNRDNRIEQIQKIQTTIQKKISGFKKIIRTENIVPTFLLSITSGFIMMPNIVKLFKSTPFIVSVVITLLIMTNSMIINDLFDMKIDKINTPMRPLITGELTKEEAFGISAAFMIITEILSMRFLNAHSQKVVDIANIVILLYTPIFKRFLFVKNLVCSGLISFATIFPALCIGNTNGNFQLLMVLFRMILFGSISLEMLYDIKDADGDLRNDIYTIPNTYGNHFTYQVVYTLLTFGILVNMLYLTCMYNFKYGIVFLFLQSPLLTRLTNVKNSVFNKKSIKKYGLQTTETLVVTLIYLCFLAFLYKNRF